MSFDWGIVALSAGAIFLGSVVHGIAGFGLAQVAMGLMPLFRDPAQAAAIFGIVAVVSNFQVWWSVRDNFRWKDLLFPVIGLAAGLPLGILVLKQLSENQVRVIIGSTLLIAVILITLFRELKLFDKWFGERELEDQWYLGLIAGFIGGVLGGAVAIPGPPMIVYGAFMVAAGLWKSKKMKAIFTAYFGILMLYRSISIVVTGDMTLNLFLEALIMIPGMLLGVWSGIKVYRFIPEKIFQWIVLGLLAVNSLVLIFT